MDSRAQVRILVADDNQELLAACADALAASGYDILTAKTGEEALHVTRRERPQVLVSDVVMPSMDGFELIERLQAELGDQAPPVIVCSGFEVTEQEALRRGARVFLPKPTDMTALVGAIEALRRGTMPGPLEVTSNRQRASDQKRQRRWVSEQSLGRFDRIKMAYRAEPWLAWLRRYLDCEAAGVFLLQSNGIDSLINSGSLLDDLSGTDLVHASVAEVVETRTSLVIGDVRAHPSFRQVLGDSGAIRFFAAVPLLTPDEIGVGALCIADSLPRRFDAESLTLTEHLGRRGVSRLFELQPPFDHAPPMEAPLLTRPSFEVLLATELAIATRELQTVELAVCEVAAGTTPGMCAQAMWRAGGGPRVAIGYFGPTRVGLFRRGPGRDVRRDLSACLDLVREGGLIRAAGVVSAGGTPGLSEPAVVRLAETALTSAMSDGTGWRLRRVMVRPEGPGGGNGNGPGGE